MSSSTGRVDESPRRSPRANIVFEEHAGSHAGTRGDGREWRITAAFTGWRLEFRDAGDVAATYAGTHPTLEAAMAEADR
jgi:hypothetical protein